MLNNFIYAQTRAIFEERLAEVPTEAIVFIEDTKEIWTHGTYFDCSTLDPSMISNIQTEITNLKSKLEQIGGAQNLWVVDSGNVYLPSGNIGVGYDAGNALDYKLSVNGPMVASDTSYFSAKSAATNNVIKCTDHNSQNLLVVHNTNGLTLFNTEGTGKAAISRDGKGTFNGGLSVSSNADFSGHIRLTNASSHLLLGSGTTGIYLTNTGISWHNTSNTYVTSLIGFSQAAITLYQAVTAKNQITATAFYESSDETLKNFGSNVNVDLEKLSKLPKKYFTWKDGDEDVHIGTSAQEVQKLYPELVSTKSDDGTLVVDYAKLSIVALAAVDKLYEENQRLKKQMSDFEERLNRLENGNRN